MSMKDLTPQLFLSMKQYTGKQLINLDYIMEYFNKTVETFPEREAVDDGVYCYGWRELHLLTQHIASAVAKKSITGRPIPVFMEKSADAVAAFLGIN